MWTGAQVGLVDLATTCRQLSMSLEAGVDLRRILSRSKTTRSGASARQWRQIAEDVHQGHTFADAVERRGKFFPPLFREMVAVGEETGHLAEVLHELAEHYELQIKLRRAFVAGLTWPAIQLGMAIAVIGLMIWIMGFIAQQPGGQAIDILGFGLVGTSGLMVYFTIVGGVALALFALVQAMRKGLLWTVPLQRLLLRVPVLGPSLRTLGLSRLAWTMQLTLDTGMSLRHALPLCLNSTQQVVDRAHIDDTVAAVMSGYEISEALAATGEYPHEFLEALEVGERSGRLPESMAILARQYQQRAQTALATLTTLAGFGVWACVAVLIIMLIFRIFFFYLGAINDALQG